MARTDFSDEAARDAALVFLSAQPRTVREVRDKLLAKGFSDDQSLMVTDWLESIGYLDDAAFAAAWVARRHDSRHASRTKLRQELRRKGVADDLVDDALEQVTGDSEAEQAKALVAKKVASTRGLPTQTRVQRLTGMLMRRGYSAGVALPIVRAALEEDAGETFDAFDDGSVS